MREQLKALLGNGVSPSQAAAAVGCQPSYVSQLLAETDFATEVANLRVNKLQEATQRDSNYDKLEDKLLAKLEDLLPFMVRPADVLKALVAVNAAKRRGAAAEDASKAGVTNIVVLQLPQAVKAAFVQNDRREVIEVEGRPLVTIDGQSLLQNLKKGARHEQATSIGALANAAI